MKTVAALQMWWLQRGRGRCPLRCLAASLLVACSLQTLAAPLATRTLTLGYGEAPGSPSARWLAQIYGEAFARIGVTIELRHVPLRRLSLSVARGELDGELSRPYDYAFYHPQLLQVRTPHTSDQIIGVAARPDLRLNGWQSLAGSHYRIDYLHGMDKIRARLLPITDAGHMTPVATIASGLRRLQRGRCDLLIVSRQQVMEVLARGQFEGSDIYNAGVVEEETWHAYLHSRHRALTEPLARVLQLMSSSGLLQGFRHQLLQPKRCKSEPGRASRRCTESVSARAAGAAPGFAGTE